MEITVELEHEEEITTPMLFADAVERFLVRCHEDEPHYYEDEPYYIENYLEVVEHLNVRANYLRRHIRRNGGEQNA